MYTFFNMSSTEEVLLVFRCLKVQTKEQSCGSVNTPLGSAIQNNNSQCVIVMIYLYGGGR